MFYDREIPGCFGIPEGWRLEVRLDESVNEVTEAYTGSQGMHINYINEEKRHRDRVQG